MKPIEMIITSAGARVLWRIGASLGMAASVVLSSACSMDSVVGKKDLPSTVADPAKVRTPNGALGAYFVAVGLFRDAIGDNDSSYVGQTALFTDEAIDPEKLRNAVTGDIGQFADGRSLPQGARFDPGGSAYRMLQRVRGQALQARGLLRDYYPVDKQGPLVAHMYAMSGYAELMLAEAFCSGIPLSTLDYKGDYTLKPGSSTVQVLDHAIAQFDSAIALSGDSVRVLNLARVGKGRALQQLGKLQDAAQAVIEVPDGFQYRLIYSVDANVCGFWTCNSGSPMPGLPPADGEGLNGLPFVSQRDGRIPPTAIFGITNVMRWDIPRNHAIRLAGGVEAQLMRAEAELEADNPNWLARLNALRTTCTDDATCPNPAPAGLGGVTGLSLLSDPATVDGRLDLLFRERAYWMFLTGHRQGDLRRLIRHYGRAEENVYPTGTYNISYLYGTDVNFPVPKTEKQLNAQYSGCINRNA